MAAAMANVDDRDNWKVHFRDTMRGGKFLNVWRMAELHARQAAERVRELEPWGEVRVHPDRMDTTSAVADLRYPSALSDASCAP